MLLALLIAASARADSLVLDHASLAARAAKARTVITYEDDCVVLRTRVKYAFVFWAVRIECVFIREGSHVRLQARKLLVQGKSMPGRLAEADARVAQLVDVESSAAEVEIRQGSEVLYSQVLDQEVVQ